MNRSGMMNSEVGNRVADFTWTELGNGCQVQFKIHTAAACADVENHFFINLKIPKNSRNTISSIKFDRELRFWCKNMRWKACEILYNFVEEYFS